jgi:hypothetical protein
MVLGLALLNANAASAQICDASVRQDYKNDVANGASVAFLESKYGHCREVFPHCGTSGNAADEKTKAGFIFNNFYEQTNGCGYHPQNRIVGCDVEIKQPFGFGPFGAAPLGSTEFVRFCLDCDNNGTWEFSTVGTVHATDNVAAVPTPSWYHLVTQSAAGAALCVPNNGAQGRMRTILSWSFMPPSCVNFQGIIWGNVMDVTIRRDP